MFRGIHRWVIEGLQAGYTITREGCYIGLDMGFLMGHTQAGYRRTHRKVIEVHTDRL